jgi:predicted metal-binding membrane protein
VSERERARRRIAVGALLLSACGWGLYLSAPADALGQPLCRSGAGMSWPGSVALIDGASFGALAAGWASMLLAMMAPTLVEPVLHVHQRSFRRRRGRSILCFALGYGAVWMLAGVLLLALQLLSGIAPQSSLPAALAGAVALLWQCSPAKQRCLNRSHNHRELAAFGWAADRDAFGFGLGHGVWCLGSCWALMLLPMLLVHGHAAAMLAVTVLMVGERLEGPQPLRWRLRGLGKLIRIVSARMRQGPSWLREALRVERVAQGEVGRR